MFSAVQEVSLKQTKFWDIKKILINIEDNQNYYLYFLSS